MKYSHNGGYTLERSLVTVQRAARRSDFVFCAKREVRIATKKLARVKTSIAVIIEHSHDRYVPRKCSGKRCSVSQPFLGALFWQAR